MCTPGPSRDPRRSYLQATRSNAVRRERAGRVSTVRAARRLVHNQVGYVIPLHDDGEPTSSYLLALSCAGPGEVMSQLQLLVEGFGAPWRPHEVRPFALDRDGIAYLPANMLLRDEIAACDWAAPSANLNVPEELVLCGSAGMLVLREDLPALREHEEARRAAGEEPQSWYPEGHGALWRTGRALILVDLDEQRLAWARTLARVGLGDFATAAGASPVVDDGQIPKTFWGPVDELEVIFAAARGRALDRLADQYYRRPVYPPRWHYVGPALRERAKDYNLAEGDVWRHAVRADLAMVAREHVPDWVETLVTRLPLDNIHSALLKRFPAAYGCLVNSMREPLNDALTSDFCPGPRQHYDGREGIVENPLQHDPLSDEVLDGDCFHEGGNPEETWLQGIDRQHRVRFLDSLERELAPRERDLLAAIRRGADPRDWQAREGLARGTLDKMLHEIREKGRKLARRMRLLD